MAGALIGALRVSLSAETSAFEAGMKRSQRTAQSTASSIKSSFGSIRGEFGLLKSAFAGFVGALSVGTLVAAGKAALDYAGSLGETAQQLGVTTRDLQTFRYAAGQVGVSQSELETGLSKLTVTLGRVAAGAKQPIAALNAIGVSVDELKGKDSGEAFRIIADGLAQIPDRAQRAAVEVALFGRAGAQLDNLLSGGSKQVNELAAAAEELGIVLSDAQIQKADDTADKLEALQTVLKAQIAGVVADNADSILGLANAIAEVAREASRAIGWLKGFYAAAQKAAAAAEIGASLAVDNSFMGLGRFIPGGAQRQKNRAAAQARIDALNKQGGADRFGAMFRGRPKTRGGSADIGDFLAGGGGGGRSRRAKTDRSAEEAERKRLEALRDANQFDQQIRRAKIDVLNSEKQLAEDYVQRRNISIQILEADRAAFDADLAYQVAAGELTQVQADQLTAERAKKDALEVQALNIEEETQRREDVARLADLDYDNQREALQLAYDLADTTKERRDLALKMVDLDYRHQKAVLEQIMADEKIGSIKWELARRALDELNKRQPGERDRASQAHRSPLEEYAASLPLDAERLNEALENVAVNGLQSLEDGLMDIITGTKSVKEAFHQMAAAILADLLRIAIQKYVIGTILKLAGVTGAADGGPVSGFAYGGFVSGPGGPKEDRVPAMLSNGEFVVNAKATKAFLPFLEQINSGAMHLASGGLALPRAGYSQRAALPANGGAMPPPMKFEFHNDFRGADPSSVARMQVELERFKAEFPGRVVATMNDAKERFVWRGDRR